MRYTIVAFKWPHSMCPPFQRKPFQATFYSLIKCFKIDTIIKTTVTVLLNRIMVGCSLTLKERKRQLTIGRAHQFLGRSPLKTCCHFISSINSVIIDAHFPFSPAYILFQASTLSEDQNVWLLKFVSLTLNVYFRLVLVLT